MKMYIAVLGAHGRALYFMFEEMRSISSTAWMPNVLQIQRVTAGA